MDLKLLTHILVNDFGVDPDALDQALRDTVVYGGSIGTNLLELGLVDEDVLLKALAKRYGTPAFDIRSLQVDTAAVAALPIAMVRKHKVLPLRIHSKTLELLMVNPLDRVALAEVGMASGCIVKPYVVVEMRLEELLEQYAGIARGWRYRENPLDRVPTKRRTIAPQSFVECKALLNASIHRDDVGDTLLAYLMRFFHRAAILVHRRELLVGWRSGLRAESDTGSIPAMDVASLNALYLPLSKQSLFKTVVESDAPIIGAIEQSKPHDYFLSLFGGGYPKNCFVAPILVMGRTVNVVYGDPGAGRANNVNLPDVVLSLSAAAAAYERLIRERLQRESLRSPQTSSLPACW